MSYLTREQFEKHLDQMRRAEYLFVDTEGTLTHPHSETWGLSYSSLGYNEYFAFNHAIEMQYKNLPQAWLPEVRQVVEQAPICVFHHMKHDLRALRNIDINRFGKKNYCIMLMAHMNDENIFDKSLDALSKKYGGKPKIKSEAMSNIINGFGYSMVPVDMWLNYAANDADITDKAFWPIYEEFKDQDFDGEYWDQESRWTEVLSRIEDAGVLIDESLAEQQYYYGLRQMRELRQALGFNPGSPIDLGKFLVDKLGLPVLKRTPKGKPSFTKDVMERYDTMLEFDGDKRAKQILAYRGWQKCTSSSYLPYLEKRSPVDNRLRTEYMQHRAKTGRLTAAVLHQIPKISSKPWNANTKKCITTESGRTSWEFDYSQLEFRMGALYAAELDPTGKTQRIIDIFNDPSRDIFEEMAKINHLERDPMKTLNYTMQFGGGARRVSEVFNISEINAKATISKYFNEAPGLLAASKFAEQEADRKGYVTYWSGRRRHFKFSSEHHKAFNSLCQGGAFEIVKRSGVRIDEAGLNNDECRMDLTVHDSFRFSIENGKEHEYIPEIRRTMEDVVSLSPDLGGVKFKVDVKKWATKEHYEPLHSSSTM